MVKAAAEPDVLILGSHPCADFAAALLRQNSTLCVMRGEVPGELLDNRLVFFNADFFELDPMLAGLKSKLDLSPIHGLKFLSDDATLRSEFQGKSIAGFVSPLKPIRAAMQKLAPASDVLRVKNKTLKINHLDENGVEVSLGAKTVKPKLLIVAAELPADARRSLGLAESWDRDVLHRYTYVKCKITPRIAIDGGENEASKLMMPMSLDLKGKLMWGWAMQSAGMVQFAIEQSAADGDVNSSKQLLAHWIEVLAKHGVIKDSAGVNVESSQTLELPLAGALAQEDVGNRTLLIGPAGGFYTACAEDIYPACWSALFAADAAKKALKEKHLQDALLTHRHKWGATLGDYLRGPQQNLRFLLSLVYKNKVMTARLAEAILFGKSVVR